MSVTSAGGKPVAIHPVVDGIALGGRWHQRLACVTAQLKGTDKSKRNDMARCHGLPACGGVTSAGAAPEGRGLRCERVV